jgi:cell division cycle protein 20 (cofactor of APC complex)
MDKDTYELKPVAKAFDLMHGRISDSCMNPDHTRLLTAGADQTVKVWKVFGEPKGRDKKESVLKEQQNVR